MSQDLAPECDPPRCTTVATRGTWSGVIDVLVNQDGAYCAVYRGYVNASEQRALREEVREKLVKPWPVLRDGHPILQPRLNWGCGDPRIKVHKYSGAVIPIEPWTPCIQKLNDRINKTFTDDPATPDLTTDSCLVNGYRDHRDSIGWHSDKETTAPHHVVVTVSTGATRTFSLWRKVPFRPKAIPEAQISTELRAGDMTVMYGTMQALYMHAVLKSKQRCLQRESFTFRELKKPFHHSHSSDETELPKDPNIVIPKREHKRKRSEPIDLTTSP